MKQVQVEKYLGDYMAVTLAESVTATVNKRIGIATHAIYEIKAIIEDSRASAVGGLTVAVDIWEMSVLPMLLSNSEN